jgi:DNA polymerase-1
LRTVVCDIECNGLTPDTIWVISCYDISERKHYTFLPFRDGYENFQDFAKTVETWVGHNFLSYDLPVLHRLVPGLDIDYRSVVDTLVLSRLVDFDREGGHSLEAWGAHFGYPKVKIDQWDTFDEQMVPRCIEDVNINNLLYNHLSKYLSSKHWKKAFQCESFIGYICSILCTNGFSFNIERCLELQDQIRKELEVIDNDLRTAFPPRLTPIREITPRGTAHGTLHRGDFRWVPDGDLSAYSIGCPFTRCEWQAFNPGSTKQIIERLNEAGWRPTEKTDGHKEAVKARPRDPERLAHFRVYGWTVSEINLLTLPDTAPEAPRKLVQRLLLASRDRRLTEWINAVRVSQGDTRVHGNFNGIGAWTHRMSHSNPNMGNIPKFDDRQPHKTPYSDVMRSLWRARPGHWLVGVDAESIQLRILAHYINDPEFTASLLTGRKEDGTDPHSVNQRALGSPCKSRNDAKTFIYAWLLGAGIAKVAQILDCSLEEARIAVDNFIDRYPGLKYLKEERIPEDAYNGWFQGFDGRYVVVRGDDQGSREHYMLGGYLQNGESCIMKHATSLWYPKLISEKVPFTFVNFVHDEWQTEVPQDLEIAKYVATTQAQSIADTGVNFGLNCPMAGSVFSDHGMVIGNEKWAIGDNWLVTH